MKIESLEDLVREQYLVQIMKDDENLGLYLPESEEELYRRLNEEHQNKITETILLPDYLVNDSEIVGFPDKEMQYDIYNWVKSKILTGGSIKDLGCGRGDFYSVIKELNEYFGIDSNINLINVGKQKYPEINLIHNNFLNIDLVSDYSICIGTLNDVHGDDKWAMFMKVLSYCLQTTNIASIFVLSRNMEGYDQYLDYPFTELFNYLPIDRRFEIDYHRYEDIYLLTVYTEMWN